MELSYQISDKILPLIQEAESLNSKINSLKISDRAKQEKRFQSLCKRISYCFVFSDIPMSVREVSNTLRSKVSSYTQKKESLVAFQISAVFDMYELLYWNYFGTHKQIPASFFIFFLGRLGNNTSRVKGVARQLKRILQTRSSQSSSGQALHPLVNASLIYILIHKYNLLHSYKGMIAHVSFWAILTAGGYSGADMLVLGETWMDDYNGYRYALETAIERGNATIWIEYFLKSYIESCERVISEFQTSRNSDIPSHSDLTERQSAILDLFLTSVTQVTNRRVQKTFRISQITASRELSALAKRGLLKQHGKGRSVFYTRSLSS